MNTIYPGSPVVRRSDPVTSHAAADKATVRRVPQKLAVEAALETAGHPVTSDEVYRIARFELGLYCTPQRVRTILAEENGSAWERLDECGVSAYGNLSHLWALKEDS